MIDWSPFDDRLEGKTSSNGMNSLDYLESKIIRQKSQKSHKKIELMELNTKTCEDTKIKIKIYENLTKM